MIARSRRLFVLGGSLLTLGATYFFWNSLSKAPTTGPATATFSPCTATAFYDVTASTRLSQSAEIRAKARLQTQSVWVRDTRRLVRFDFSDMVRSSDQQPREPPITASVFVETQDGLIRQVYKTAGADEEKIQAIKPLAVVLQAPKIDTSRPGQIDTVGRASFSLTRKTDTRFELRKLAYEVYHPNSPQVEIQSSLFKVQLDLAGDIESLNQDEKSRFYFDDSLKHPIESQYQTQFQRTKKVDGAFSKHCSLPTLEQAVQKLGLVAIPFGAPNRSGSGGKAREQTARTLLESYPNLKKQLRSSDNKTKYVALARLTEILSFYPAYVDATIKEFNQVKSQEEAASLLIGMIGGATGEYAQAALRKILTDLYGQPEHSHLLETAIRAQQANQTPARENVELLRMYASNPQSSPEIQNAALLAYAASASHLSDQSSSPKYAAELLERFQRTSHPTQRLYAIEAMGNLANESLLPGLIQIVEASDRVEAKHAVSAMRQLPPGATDRQLVQVALQATHSEAQLEAVSILKERSMEEATVRSLIAAYDKTATATQSQGRNQTILDLLSAKNAARHRDIISAFFNDKEEELNLDPAPNAPP